MCPRGKQLENATTHSDKADKFMRFLKGSHFHFLQVKCKNNCFYATVFMKVFPNVASKFAPM